MGQKLSKAELKKTKADFDVPAETATNRKKPKSLLEKVTAKEKEITTSYLTAPKKATVTKITSSSAQKTKIISAKMYPDTFEDFTRINKARGMSNSSVLNMLVTEYIREQKGIFEDKK